MAFQRIFLVFFLLLFAKISLAQDQFVGENFKLTLKSFGQYALLSFELQDDVKFYWRNPGELGLPTKFKFEKTTNLESAQVFWPIPELYQANHVTSYIYQSNTDFVIKPIAKKEDRNIELNLNISFTTCQKTCNNHDISLSTIVNPQPTEIPAVIIEALAKTPHSNGSGNLTI